MKQPKSPHGIFIARIRNLEAKWRSERKLKFADELKACLDELKLNERLAKAPKSTHTSGGVSLGFSLGNSLGKEEAKGKREISPYNPLLEKKGSEEENVAAVVRVRTREEICPESTGKPPFEMVVSRAKTTLNCRDMDFLREWYEDQCASDWRDSGGNPLHNWGRKLALDWRYWEKNKAGRVPNLAAARRNEEENALENLRAMRMKAIAEACEGLEDIDA